MATPYSDKADVRKESPFKDDQAIDDNYVTQCIAEADDIIDSYIGQVYQLPLPSTNPPLIKSLSKDIAICLLFMDQNPNVEIMSGVNVNDRYEDLLKMLDSIRTRKTILKDSSNVELPLNGNTLPQFYPNDASSDASVANNTASKFTMNKKF